jgi:hypothetical protein
LRSVKPATAAALIGAGVASGVSLLSQLLAHSLCVRRDRRNQRRERAYETVLTAASALLRIYEPEDYSNLDPESFGAMHPKQCRSPPARTEALTRLSVHFGCEHWLLDEYEKVASESVERVIEFHELLRLPEESRADQIPEHARRAFQSKRAADEWVAQAMREVERL